MSVSNFPQYATTYGEEHGYNSRRGSNNAEFKNRYQNPAYNTPTVRNGSRKEFEPRGNPYGPYDGMSAQAQEASMQQQMVRTQPIMSAPQAQQRAQSYDRSSAASPTQKAGAAMMSGQGGYEGYLPKSYEVVGRRPLTPPLRRPGLTRDFEESQKNFGKQSVSRRLPERERLRYHVPGYMGFVKNIQFLHGDTYGKTTRKCILAPGVVEY